MTVHPSSRWDGLDSRLTGRTAGPATMTTMHDTPVCHAELAWVTATAAWCRTLETTTNRATLQVAAAAQAARPHANMIAQLTANPLTDADTAWQLHRLVPQPDVMLARSDLTASRRADIIATTPLADIGPEMLARLHEHELEAVAERATAVDARRVARLAAWQERAGSALIRAHAPKREQLGEHPDILSDAPLAALTMWRQLPAAIWQALLDSPRITSVLWDLRHQHPPAWVLEQLLDRNVLALATMANREHFDAAVAHTLALTDTEHRFVAASQLLANPWHRSSDHDQLAGIVAGQSERDETVAATLHDRNGPLGWARVKDEPVCWVLSQMTATPAWFQPAGEHAANLFASLARRWTGSVADLLAVTARV